MRGMRGGGWSRFGIRLRGILSVLTFAVHFLAQGSLSVNIEGLALLEFRSRVKLDPYSSLENWNPRDRSPCGWNGVRCVNGRVMAFVLYKNNFSGVIRKEIGRLGMLEILDLRNNKLNGSIPTEIGEMLSLKHLLLCNNKLQGSKQRIGTPNLRSDLIYDNVLSCDVTDVGCLNRKVGYCFWETGLQNLRRVNMFLIQIKRSLTQLISASPLNEKDIPDEEEKKHMNIAIDFGKSSMVSKMHLHNVRRRLLEVSQNIRADSGSIGPVNPAVTLQPSGTYHAKDQSKSKPGPVPPPTSNSSPSTTQTKSSVPEPGSNKRTAKVIYALVVPVVSLLVIFAIFLFVVSRRKGAAPIGPWKTGLSGQLQKVFVTGVPKLNRSELEAACEDFSNIIISFPECTVYKDTLSSGVEIAVVSTVLSSAKDWPKHSEVLFRKKKFS